MKRIVQVLFAAVALALLAADPPITPKSASTDDPAELTAIGDVTGAHVELHTIDGSPNIDSIQAADDRRKPGVWMKHLKGLGNLTGLELPGPWTEDDDLAYLVGLRSLQRLEVKDGKFSDAGMKSIGAVAGLCELCLARCAGITSAKMKYVGQLENLERLDLRESPVTDEELRHLDKLTKLKELNLAGTEITDAGLVHLAALASLEQLHLNRTSVTDAGLQHLRGLKKLRDVFCNGTAVTREGLIRLNRDIPGLLLPDDPADVAELLKHYPVGTKFDAHGNIIEIDPLGYDLQRFPTVGPALRRLHHVQKVSLNVDGDIVLVDVIKNWSELEAVSLWCGATDDDLRDLEGLQKMKDLGICDGHNMTDEGVKSIARLKNLEGLIIRNNCLYPLTDACMKDIASLPKLKRLDLQGNAITDKGLKLLKGKKLEFLVLRTTKITDRGIDEIKDMTSLRYLDVVNTKVTNTSLRKLKGIPELEVLGLPRKELREIPDDPDDAAAIQAAGLGIYKSNVTDNIYDVDANGDRQKPGQWMKHLKGLHSLKELKLPKTINDEDLRYLVGLKSLETLWVGGDFSDEGLKAIGTLTNLKELLCYSKRLTSASAKHLAPLVSLERLELNDDPIGDEGLRYLAGMKKLKNLGLIGTRITDAGLVHLQGLSALEEINLMFTAVTDDGLRNLRGLKKLTSIHGVGSREAQLRLKKDLPELVVPREPPPNVIAP